MGLVGCFLSLIANQLSVDYLKTEDFARRPLAWLDLISRNPGTTVSYSPTFGYDICARRISSQSHVEDRFDLSRWRVAGNGADDAPAVVLGQRCEQRQEDELAARRPGGEHTRHDAAPGDGPHAGLAIARAALDIRD